MGGGPSRQRDSPHAGSQPAPSRGRRVLRRLHQRMPLVHSSEQFVAVRSPFNFCSRKPRPCVAVTVNTFENLHVRIVTLRTAWYKWHDPEEKNVTCLIILELEFRDNDHKPYNLDPKTCAIPVGLARIQERHLRLPLL